MPDSGLLLMQILRQNEAQRQAFIQSCSKPRVETAQKPRPIAESPDRSRNNDTAYSSCPAISGPGRVMQSKLCRERELCRPRIHEEHAETLIPDVGESNRFSARWVPPQGRSIVTETRYPGDRQTSKEAQSFRHLRELKRAVAANLDLVDEMSEESTDRTSPQDLQVFEQRLISPKDCRIYK